MSHRRSDSRSNRTYLTELHAVRRAFENHKLHDCFQYICSSEARHASLDSMSDNSQWIDQQFVIRILPMMAPPHFRLG